jgi:UbiD family decarboxylase
MSKSLSTFLEDCRREIPNEVVNFTKTIDPAHYDATAIIKHLGAQKKFPIAIFEQPLNLHGKVSTFKLVLNCEISQRKTQIALKFPRTMTRGEMAEACLAREAQPIPPIIIDQKDAPVKQVIKRGADVDLYQLPIMRHHEMDGGPYSTLSTIARDRKSGIYNCSYHRMEIKFKNRTALYASPRHLWRIYRDYEEQNRERCPWRRY